MLAGDDENCNVEESPSNFENNTVIKNFDGRKQSESEATVLIAKSRPVYIK